ncbi:hypothetical protein EDD21DRAFT_366492 [Dissophora ornata]|nr:hypothetical protein EDD21DRAFT_366492 [Dissophora ornata]
MKRLDKLTIRKPSNEEDVIMGVSKSRIGAVETRFPSLKLITKSDQEFISKGLLTKVAVGIDYGDEALLPDVLSSDPSLSPQLSMQDGSFIPPHESPPVQARTWKSLTRIQLMGLFLQPDDWRKVVEAIDFSALESLSFRHSNFGLDELKNLVNCISGYGDPDLPLVTLDLFNAHVGQDRMNVDIDEQLKRLKTMKPLVEIECC